MAANMFDDEPSEQERAHALAAALRGQRALGTVFSLDPVMQRAGHSLLGNAAKQGEIASDENKANRALSMQQLLSQRNNAAEMQRLKMTLGAKDKADADARTADAAKRITDAEGKIRGEFTNLPLTKETSATASAFQSIKSAFASKTAAGDMAGVFAFMKSLDPTSSVRESEYASAKNAAGVPDQIRNMYNKALAGTLLTDGQRSDFIARAKDRYATQVKLYNSAADSYARMAPEGANRANIIPVSYDLEEEAGTAPPAVSPEQDAAALDWAKKNPGDPRAKTILKTHGMQL